MAELGSKEDFFDRTKALLVEGWFGDVSPVLDGLVMGYAESRAFEFAQERYVKNQQRSTTATDINLDLIALDFFGPGRMSRRELEGDESYRARIHANLFREKGTRKAVEDVLFELTGKKPLIFEPALTTDTGGLGADNENRNTNFAYDIDVGGYGDLDMPFQCFIDIYSPQGIGIANVQGYGDLPYEGKVIGGFDAGAMQLADLNEGLVQITEADVLDALNATMPVSMRAWVRFI